MKVYLVGGCVRDEILGLDIEHSDKDYLVLESSVDEMLKQGFLQVGKSFPVFIHPETKEEYALARKEIKTGRGYKEFDFIFTPDITLKEDLKRRDFTINAIAKDQSGKLYDPYNGVKDLENRVLRHVSDHFIEDPLRVLRAARFLSTFNFSLANETKELILKIVKNGEIQELTNERVLLELEKVFKKGSIKKFCEYLDNWGVFEILFSQKFKNISSYPSFSLEDQFALFFINFKSPTIQKYKLPKKVVNKILLVDKAQALWGKTQTNELYKLMSLLGFFKKHSYELALSHYRICEEVLDSHIIDLVELFSLVDSQLSLEGLELFKGKAYGDELALRYMKLIDKNKVKA